MLRQNTRCSKSYFIYLIWGYEESSCEYCCLSHTYSHSCLSIFWFIFWFIFSNSHSNSHSVIADVSIAVYYFSFSWPFLWSFLQFKHISCKRNGLGGLKWHAMPYPFFRIKMLFAETPAWFPFISHTILQTTEWWSNRKNF